MKQVKRRDEVSYRAHGVDSILQLWKVPTMSLRAERYNGLWYWTLRIQQHIYQGTAFSKEEVFSIVEAIREENNV